MDTTTHPEESGSTAEDTQVHPQDNVDQTTDEQKDSTEESAPQETETDSGFEKRYKDAQGAIQERSEEINRIIDINAKLVEKNPDVLDDLAETDLKLADKISEKLYGKKYEMYKTERDLSDLKESNPEEYSTQKRLRELEAREAERISQAQESFLQGKGIKANEFDANFTKLQDQMKLLNPTLVQEDPLKALELAYSMAFTKASDPIKEKEAEALAANTVSGGSKSSGISTGGGSSHPAAAKFTEIWKKAA